MKDFFTIENLKKTKKNSYKILGDTAIITGGCGRIGSVFTSIFLSYGLKVIILSRTNNDYLNYKSSLSAGLKKNITWLKFDLTKPKSIDMVENWLKKKNIQPNYLVNNASYSFRGKFFNYNSKSVNQELWGTFGGSFYFTEKILKIMRKKKSGNIIFVGSLWGVNSPRFQTYLDMDIGPSPLVSAGKAAMLQYAKHLVSRESEFNIKINSLIPGWFPRKGPVERKDYVDEIKKNIPLNRIGNLQDLVTAVEYLISSESAYATGQNIVVDGGYSIY